MNYIYNAINNIVYMYKINFLIHSVIYILIICF